MARSLDASRYTCSMPVSHEYRAIFVHIPKCGGSSVERALGMHGDYRVENRTHLYGRAISADLQAIAGPVHYLQHLSAADLRRALIANGFAHATLAEWKSFAFVRNPFDRLVSAWAGQDPDLRACARAQGIELRGLSFAQFVDASVLIDHPHVAPQVPFIYGAAGVQQVDFIGRFERLADDFERVCDLLQLEGDARPVLPHSHRSSHAHYRDLFDVRSRTLAMRRYREDLAVLGYDF